MVNGNGHAGAPGLTEIAGTWVTPRVDVLGVGVSAIDMPMTLHLIDRWISQGDRRYICVTAVHGVMESQRDPLVRYVHNRSGLTAPDGMPLVWAGRAAGARHMDRVYGPDLMLAAQPDLVWVGLGTPKQELWMAAHAHRIDAAVLIGVGAAFDIHAGLTRQAPHWIQRSGLEWAFRLAQEPRRLWRRYLYNNPRFLAGVARRPPCLVPVTGEASATGDPLLPMPGLLAGPKPPGVVTDDSC
jgi:N-acetylglucosaminyldiphosphoundecaprenol N-acetyl-beta-D-mannosaminyltransferase